MSREQFCWRLFAICRRRKGDIIFYVKKAHGYWKSRARLTPEGKAALTPENLLFLTPVKS